jgi:hypothetical protein
MPIIVLRTIRLKPLFVGNIQDFVSHHFRRRITFVVKKKKMTTDY